MHFFATQGHTAVGVDRHPEAVALAKNHGDVTCADIENGPWPFAGQTFDCVVVTNYLWRSLFPIILQSLAPGGVIIYETFAAGNETVGKPSRPDFLLQPGELLRATEGLHTVAYEDGFEASPNRFVQRIVAIRRKTTGEVTRWPLNAKDVSAQPAQ
jgi:SAM-dependent methyltransferase